MAEARRILVLNTGGTFTMLKNEKGVMVTQKNIEQVIRNLPQLHDEEYWKQKLENARQKEYLALPASRDAETKVLYKIHEYENTKDWITMARDVKRFHDDYDGFVILHGTDTMAYGSSLLSFMLESLGKPVVLTGAQVPIIQPRSDGVNNFLCSLLIAATLYIPEVMVFFGDKLFRGTRLKKVSNSRICAFDSPNFPPLLEAKTTLEVDHRMLIHPLDGVPNECRLHDKLSSKVYVLKVAPTITAELFKRVCDGLEGLVLETYGDGNIPIQKILDNIREAVEKKVLIVNVTQCLNGTVLEKPLYESGSILLECGVVPAFDMTSEAALAKLSYVLGKTELTYKEKIELMKKNVCGELFNPNPEFQ